jgi:exodeoxyribonuclease V alpha subunit
VACYATVLSATAAGIQKCLGSGLIKGIGPVMAERMVARFGAGIMHVIDDEPGRLAWAGQKAIKEVMIFLQGVGASTSLAVRICKKYGGASVSVVRGEPYRLAAGVWGIGFRTADAIARSAGIAPDSPERVKAGLACALSGAADDGHCCLPAPGLITGAATILDVPAGQVTPCLDDLAAAGGWSASRSRRGGPRAGPGGAPARAGAGRTAGPRRLPAALLSGRTVAGLRPAAPARRPGRPARCGLP